MFHCLHHSACLCLWRFKLSYWIATDVYLHIKREVLFLHLHMKLRFIFQSQQCESLSTVTFDQFNASLQNKITPNIEWHCIHLNRIYSNYICQADEKQVKFMNHREQLIKTNHSQESPVLTKKKKS